MSAKHLLYEFHTGGVLFVPTYIRSLVYVGFEHRLPLHYGAGRLDVGTLTVSTTVVTFPEASLTS